MNTEIEQRSGADNVPAGEMSQTDMAKFVKEIDVYLGQTFDAMAVIDESYGKVSSFFMECANQTVGDSDFDKLSEEEQKEAMLYMAAALAVQGVCAITKGIKETVALEKVKRLHRQVAEVRQDSLPRMIERARRNHDDAAMLLLRHNGHPFNSREIKKSFESTADLLESELCQYRDVRFRLDMLLWLKDEYEAWMEGRLYSDTPMPTMGQSTIAAIYLVAGKRVKMDAFTPPEMIPALVEAAQPPVSVTNLNADLRQFGTQLVEGLDFSKFPNGKDFVSAFEILAVVDRQMAAVLEYYSLDENPFAPAKDGENEDDGDYGDIDFEKFDCTRLYANVGLKARNESFPQIGNTVIKNPVCMKSMNSYDAFLDMKKQEDSGTDRAGINGLMIAAAAIIPVWTLGWKWYWALGLSLVIIVVVYKWIIMSMVDKITDRFLDKFSMMSVNYKYLIESEAGLIQPKSKIREMEKSRNHFWAGLIIGGIIGMIAGPIGAIIGAIIGAVIGSGSDEDFDDHGEGWEEIKICSPVKQWFVTIALAAVLIFEIIGLFVK